MKIRTWMVGLMLGIHAGQAFAQEPGPVMAAAGYGGTFSANRNPQLSGQDADGAFALSFDHHVARHIAVGVDLNVYGQSFDSGMGGDYFFGMEEVSDRMQVDTMSLSGQLLLTAMRPRAGAWLGAGAGLYNTHLTVDAELWGIDGTAVDEKDNRLGYHYVAGAGLGFTEHVWCVLQVRRVEAEADFGEYSRGRMDVGGEFVYFGIQYVAWGARRPS